MGSERFERRAYSLLVIWGMKFRYGVRFLFCASNEFEQGSLTLEGPIVDIVVDMIQKVFNSRRDFFVSSKPYTPFFFCIKSNKSIANTASVG